MPCLYKERRWFCGSQFVGQVAVGESRGKKSGVVLQVPSAWVISDLCGLCEGEAPS